MNPESISPETPEYTPNPGLESSAGTTKTEAPTSRKRLSPLVLMVVILIILAVITAVLYIFIGPKRYKGVVDPTALTSKCVGANTITWWLPDTPQTQAANYTSMIAAYNKLRDKNSQITVDIVNRKYDEYNYYSNLLAAMAKNAGPDIMALRNDDLSSYREYILPFATVDTKKLELYKKAFVDIVGQDTIFNDKLYGIATYVDNLQLYYNKELLDQNSVPRPASSWSDIQKQSRTLSKSKEKGFSLSTISLGIGSTPTSNSNIIENQDIVPMIISQYGGTIYDTKTNQIGFQINDKTRQAFIDGVNFYLSFSSNTSTNYSWDEYMGQNVDEFLQGRLVYMVGYKELDQTLKLRRPDLDYQVTSLPQFNPLAKKTFGKYFVNTMSRALGTADQTNANIGVKRACTEDFLTYMATPEAQKLYTAASQMPSASREVLNDQLNISGDQKTRTFAEGVLIATSYYKPDVVNAEKIWGQMITDARGQKDVTNAVSAAVDKYNELITQGPVIRQR